MKLRLTFILFLTVAASYAQRVQIEPAGQKLKDVYLSMDVEHLWIAGHHVNWQTGEPDMPESKHGIKTHCSAFIAAVCLKLNVYVLRPPQHGQILLANAQAIWLDTDSAKAQGWQKLTGDTDIYTEAQQLANQGKIVIAIYKNTDAKLPGHAALIMPSNRLVELLRQQGPEIIMAGTYNFNYISLRNGFKNHITNWPEPAICFYVHDGF